MFLRHLINICDCGALVSRQPFLAFALLLCLVVGGGAQAASWETGGFTFSDELGGFRLLSASGSGSLADPIVLVEELTGPGPAVLLIRNHDFDANPSLGGQQRAGSFLGLVMVKRVTNSGPYRWSGFEMELRQDLGQPSVYSDGLSFDQIGSIRQDLYADRFSQVKKANEPYDRLIFDRGRLEPSETASFFFNIVDLSPGAIFYLVQEPIMLLSRHAPLEQHQLAGRPGVHVLALVAAPTTEAIAAAAPRRRR